MEFSEDIWAFGCILLELILGGSGFLAPKGLYSPNARDQIQPALLEVVHGAEFGNRHDLCMGASHPKPVRGMASKGGFRCNEARPRVRPKS
jgi:hypothetical protein